MSKQTEDAIVWIYRSVIGGLACLTFFFVKSNYDDFREMKTEVTSQKSKHAIIEFREQDFEKRITRLEKKAK